LHIISQEDCGRLIIYLPNLGGSYSGESILSTSQERQQKLEYALKYFELGYSVIPVKEDKTPFIKWEPYQKKKASKEEIKGWFTKFGEPNIALITGEISDLFVVDTDTPASIEQVQNSLPENIVTPIQQTPHGGKHFFFKHQEGFSNRARLAPGVDIRTTGGYVVVEPSSNGNGQHWTWVDGLSPFDISVSALPNSLLFCLKEFALDSNTKYYTSSYTPEKVTEGHDMFREGTRDQDLFHIANQLIRSRTDEAITAKVIEILAQNCNPPFSKKEAQIKVKSALERAKRKEFNLAEDFRKWVEVTEGHFSLTNYHAESFIVTPEQKHALVVLCNRMIKEGILEKYGDKRGMYRKVEKNADKINWEEADDTPISIKWPFEIETVVDILPKSIAVVAGEKDAGKTAFLLNTCLLNLEKEIHYFSSEMVGPELKKRLKKFEIPLKEWRQIDFRERTEKYSDVISPDAINIIDFLEIYDEFYRMSFFIKEIFDKLNKGIAIIAIQKNPGVDWGLGGMRSMEKARLYLSISKGKLKIISGKNWASGLRPEGLIVDFRLLQGAKFIKDSEWYREKT
jgi:hypothetical protein